MNLLAFESSAKAASVAVFSDGELLGEQYRNDGLTHSQTLLPMAQQLLQDCNLQVADIDAVAVAAGPGSFTGVRIGVAAAKGFAWGAQIPCYGVSTLESMARQMKEFEGYILPVMDARRQQVYTALFEAANGTISRLWEDQAISLEQLAEGIKTLQKPIFLVGDGSILCYNALKEAFPGLVLQPEDKMHQRSRGVGLAALAAIANGAEGDAAALTPNYLRLSQAERERLERLQK